MFIDFLRTQFLLNADKEAIAGPQGPADYAALDREIGNALCWVDQQGIVPGTTVALEADFSLEGIAMLLALIERSCLIAPVASTSRLKKAERCNIAEIEAEVCWDGSHLWRVSHTGRRASHPLYAKLRSERLPGLTLFSSGSTGKSKAILHDVTKLLDKFKRPRAPLRMTAFLLFDHIGGFNTLLHSLSNAACLVLVRDRSPDAVCSAIAEHRVEVLATTPSFLRLLLVSEAYKRYDLSTLQLITYGTEVMPGATLQQVSEVFPQVRLQQTYGLSEIGIMRSKSKSTDSVWVKIGGEGFQTRVVHGMLEIKAASTMLGYLNAPSPFTEDGWFKTGDAVEVDGEFMHILGRNSELINVGGEKVYPAEVESVLQMMSGVEDAIVCAEANTLLGQIVTARVKLISPERLDDFRRRMRLFCKTRLSNFAIPQKVELIDSSLTNECFKKIRHRPPL